MNKMLRISTISVVAKISCGIDTDKIKENDEKRNLGFYLKSGVHFGNQVSIKHEKDNINIKLFKNGSIQIAGFRSIHHIDDKLQQIIDYLLVATGMQYNILNSRVVMINGDFDLGFPVLRKEFCDYFQKQYCDLFFSFEPCIYQGIIIKYFYNLSNNEDRLEQQGRCVCSDTKKCNGKGRGEAIGDCRKISIIIFHSGKVIITGAVSMDQVFKAQLFIKSVMEIWKTL
jgi:TATA-box binding protein (TBP) (component of TFIID and TFIIIB)